jgi:hypothetical protein
MPSVEISPLIHQNSTFIRQLARCQSDTKRRRLLKTATTSQLLALAEICLNIVASRFPLTSRQKKRLLPYADFVRRMGRMRSEKGARKFAIQRGSGAGGLFAALLTPILIELARSVIIKGNKNETPKLEK